jgi:hypothetical protein
MNETMEAYEAARAGHAVSRKMRLAANKVAIERDVNGETLTFYVTGYEAEDIYKAMIAAHEQETADE